MPDGERGGVPSDGWPSYAHLVLGELEKNNEAHRDLYEHVRANEVEIARLQERAKISGAIAGVIAGGVVSLVIGLLLFLLAK